MMALSFLRKIFIPIILCFVFSASGFAQDSLPNFSVVDRGSGRVVVSWKNPYPNMIQVAVQRSYDSLRRYATIYSAESPELPQNGFTDQVYGGIKVYYRIFYSIQGGAYFFSKVKRPMKDTGVLTTETDLRRDKVTEAIKDLVASQPERKFFVKLYDSLFTTLMDGDYTRFKDSIVSQTKDTLTLLANDTILLKRYNPPFLYRTSIYIYPNRDGYIVIDLPEALTKHYELFIREEDDTPVLNLKKISATYLTLDKADFYHGGWYKFELWEDGQLKEKNKIFLAKDF